MGSWYLSEKSGSLAGAEVLSAQGGWEGTWCVPWEEWVDPALQDVGSRPMLEAVGESSYASAELYVAPVWVPLWFVAIPRLILKKDIPLTQLILAVLWSMLLVTCDAGARLSAEHLSKDNIDFYHDVEIGKNILQGGP